MQCVGAPSSGCKALRVGHDGELVADWFLADEAPDALRNGKQKTDVLSLYLAHVLWYVAGVSTIYLKVSGRSVRVSVILLSRRALSNAEQSG